MNQLSQIIAFLRTRTGLIIIVAVLAALNIGRLASDKYTEYVDSIESKRALLGQYKISTRDIDALRQRVKKLEEIKSRFDAHLFTGTSREDVTSAMQIKLQEILALSGLNPESLRPINKARKKEEETYYGEVTIKLRLTGSLENFVKFLSQLYRMNYLFTIENFVIKPYKKKDLKVFLELKGFYRLAKPS